MGNVKDIVEIVDQISNLVKDTRELAKAVTDARLYLEKQHTEVKDNLKEMLSEIQKTITGLIEATSVVSRFKFTVIGAGLDNEPTRFNEYSMAQAKKVNLLENQIDSLKGSCEKIADARNRLNELGGDANKWTSMFRLFGESKDRMDLELADKLSGFYADDKAVIEQIEKILKLSLTALDEANEALGPPGHAYPYNVPLAAAVLQIYSSAFEKSEAELKELSNALREAVRSLSKT